MENENIIESSEIESMESTEVNPSDQEHLADAPTDETDDLQETTEPTTEEIESISDSGSGSSLTADDVKNAVLSALDEWQQTELGESVVGYYSPGMQKPLESFTLTEICLVVLVLIALGGSIMKIIGGRAHE